MTQRKFRGIYFWFCENAVHCYRLPVSETLDLTIIGGQLAGTIFTHPVPSEALLEDTKGIPGTALP